MTDCKNLELAREWAADIDADRETLSQDTIDAAADLINGLPDAWVSVDTLRKYISDWREGLATAPRGNYEAEMLDDLEALLPAPPAPRTMAEIEWDDAEHHMAEASVAEDDLDGNISDTVVMLKINEFGNIWALDTSTWGAWALSRDTLTPTGRKYRLEPAESIPKGDPIETDDDHASHCASCAEMDDDEPEFDPAYTYRDRAADGLPAPSRTMSPGGRVWYIEGPVGDVRATSTGQVVAFGTWQEQPFRIVSTPEEMRTLARTLEAAADHAETEVTDG